MATELAVELGDLRGWSRQVTRAGGHCGDLSTYVSSNVTDGDFGMILELITGPYEDIIPVFTQALSTDATRLDSTGSALDGLATDFKTTDAKVAQSLGPGKAITDDKTAAGFYDVAGVIPAAPYCDTAELPKVSFGAILDKICDLTNWVVGIDPREYVTRWIAGDIEKAALQASAWEHVGQCLDGVEKNLASGQSEISGTWRGEAATGAKAYVDQWLTSLGEQSRGATKIGAHLRDMIRGAVDLAQNVVDIIRMIISICSAALSSSYIPVWGQWKAIKTIKEAWEMFKTARKAIQAFWQIITTIKNLIITLAHDFTIESLPTAPTLPAAV